MREERLHFRFAHLVRVNPLAGAIVVKPQEFLDPPSVGLDRAGSQPANLAGGFVFIEELHGFQCAPQELLGQFARSIQRIPMALRRLICGGRLVFSMHSIQRITSSADGFHRELLFMLYGTEQ
jgi:hypothetical protein